MQMRVQKLLNYSRWRLRAGPLFDQRTAAAETTAAVAVVATAEEVTQRRLHVQWLHLKLPPTLRLPNLPRARKRNSRIQSAISQTNPWAEAQWKTLMQGLRFPAIICRQPQNFAQIWKVNHPCGSCNLGDTREWRCPGLEEGRSTGGCHRSRPQLYRRYRL